MAPLPDSDAGAQIAFNVVMAVFVLGEVRVRVGTVLNRQGSRSDRGSFALIYVTFVGGLVAAFVLAGGVHGAAISFARWPLFVAGLILMALGVVIRQWAVTLLGRFFTTDVRVHEDHTVIDTGPYRWVRHPAYTGLILVMLGIGLALGNWAALAVLAIVPTAGLVFRIRVEERALIEGIGEPYRRFAAGRRRLIPGVW